MEWILIYDDGIPSADGSCVGYLEFCDFVNVLSGHNFRDFCVLAISHYVFGVSSICISVF